MLEARFTQERMNKIQGYLNEIGRVQYYGKEDFKIFIDNFRKLIGDVRSIDPMQVPTDVNLMGVLKKAVSSELVLWAHLNFADNITLDKMLDVISKWKSKTSKSESTAVANYTDLSGNLKKAYGKKKSLAAAVERTKLQEESRRERVWLVKRSDIWSKTAKISL